MNIKFNLEFGQKVKHKTYPIIGQVIACAAYDDGDVLYDVKSLTSNGEIVENWIKSECLEIIKEDK